MTTISILALALVFPAPSLATEVPVGPTPVECSEGFSAEDGRWSRWQFEAFCDEYDDPRRTEPVENLQADP